MLLLFFPSSSNETAAAQRERAEATSSQTTTPRVRTVAPVHPNEDRQGPELPFEKITIFRIPSELPEGYSGTAQYLGELRDRFNEHPQTVPRSKIITRQRRYAGPSPDWHLERQGRVLLEALDPKTGRTGYGNFRMDQLCWDSLGIIQRQIREWREWQEQADQREEEMQNPFTRDRWTVNGKPLDDVKFINTTVDGEWARFERKTDGNDAFLRLDTLDPEEAKLIRNLYQRQAEITFAATGDLHLAIVMFPQVEEELRDRLDTAALRDPSQVDAGQPQTVEELLQTMLPDGVEVKTIEVTGDLGEVSSFLKELFGEPEQEGDQPLYPVTITDPRELELLRQHVERLLNSLREQHEQESL